MSGEATATDQYLKCWEKWYPQQQNIGLGEDDRMIGYVERRPTHVHKLAMVFNASRGGDLRLDECDFKRAVGLLEETERKMANTFAGVGKSQFASIMNRVLQYLRAKGEATYSETLNNFYYDADDATLQVAVATLERAKLITVDRTRIEGHRDYYLIYSAGDDIPDQPMATQDDHSESAE